MQFSDQFDLTLIQISEVGGKNPQPGNLFLFRFVFVSCVPCVRAGEAKLREGVRGRGASSTLVPRLATFPAPPSLDFALVCLLKKLMGFNRKSVLELLNLVGFLSISLSVLLFVWVLKRILYGSRQLDVIIVGFKGIFAMLLQ